MRRGWFLKIGYCNVCLRCNSDVCHVVKQIECFETTPYETPPYARPYQYSPSLPWREGGDGGAGNGEGGVTAPYSGARRGIARGPARARPRWWCRVACAGCVRAVCLWSVPVEFACAACLWSVPVEFACGVCLCSVPVQCEAGRFPCKLVSRWDRYHSARFRNVFFQMRLIPSEKRSRSFHHILGGP